MGTMANLKQIKATTAVHPSLYEELVAALERLAEVEAAQVINQVTKLNIMASVESPYTVDLPVEAPPNFAVQAPTVLYLDAVIQDLVETQCAFDNSDASSFEPNDVVVFDGQMKLRTSVDMPFVEQGEVGAGKMYSLTIDPTKYKSISQIEVI